MKKNRCDIPDEFKWRLEDIYKTDQHWLNDMTTVRDNVKKIRDYKGKLTETAKNLYDGLNLNFEILEMRDKVYMYALKKSQEDLRDSNSQAMLQKAGKFRAEVEGELSFVKTEILDISDEMFSKFTVEVPELFVYNFYIKNILKDKLRTLSEIEERIVNKAGMLVDSSFNIYNKLKDADMFNTYEIENEDDNVIKIEEEKYKEIMKGNDRELRLKAFKAKHRKYLEIKHTLAELYISSVKRDSFITEVRKYNSNIERCLAKYNIPVDIYESLIMGVHNNLSKVHRFYDVYRRCLGLENIHLYDIDAPIIEIEPIKIEYKKAIEYIKDCYSILGDEYVNSINVAFKSGWIDAYYNHGKRSTECTGSIYGVHPYVLLNYKDDINDFIILNHEIGHALNTHYAFNAQPYVDAYYGELMGESIAQVNEILAIEYLIRSSDKVKTEIYLITKYLQMINAAIIRQTMFAEFEKIIHDKYEKDEALSTEVICHVFHKLAKEYYGHSMIIDDEFVINWATMMHIFKNPFYVYSYALGMSISISIANRIVDGDNDFISTYLEFIKIGGSKHPVEAISTIGIDITSPMAMQTVFVKYEELTNRLEKLIKIDK